MVTTHLGKARLYLSALVFFASSSIYAGSGWTDYGYVEELIPTIHHRFKVNIALKGNKSGCKGKTVVLSGLRYIRGKGDVSGFISVYVR